MPRKRTRSSRKRIPARHLPKGWTQKRAREIAAYYDYQSDEEAIAQAQAAYAANDSVMMPIPLQLLPKVEKLIARASDKPSSTATPASATQRPENAARRRG
jgi:hypothetical protein